MDESKAVIHRVTQEEAYEKALALIQELRPVGHCGEPNLIAETLTALDFYVRNCLKPAASPVAGVSALEFVALLEEFAPHMNEMSTEAYRRIAPKVHAVYEKLKLAQPSAEGDGALPQELVEGIAWWKDGKNADSFSETGLRDFIDALIAKLPQKAAEGDGWIAEPTEQGWWWHIDAGEHTDMIPFMYGILLSGTNGKMFIQYPDSRWCSDVGGLWAKATPPALPAKEGTR